jgi:hypothetical protein
MNSKATAITSILTALAAGCDSGTSPDTSRDSAVEVRTNTDRSSGMGGPTETGVADASACIDQLISAARAAPVGNPPVGYYQCTYRGQPVYYTPPQCCDQFSKLFAADCTLICAPDGGLSGGGDGRCPDFDWNTCTLLWQDTRTR